MVIVADLVRKLMLSSQTKLLRGTQVQFNTYGQTIFQFSYGFVQGKSRFGKQAAGVKDGIQLRCPVCISQITLHLWRIAPLTSLHTINERRRRQDQRAFHWIECLTEVWSQRRSYGSFSAAHPKACGWAEAYLPGYSKDGLRAIVRAGVGPSAHGAVVTALLEKIDGRWVVKWHHIASYV